CFLSSLLFLSPLMFSFGLSIYCMLWMMDFFLFYVFPDLLLDFSVTSLFSVSLYQILNPSCLLSIPIFYCFLLHIFLFLLTYISFSFVDRFLVSLSAFLILSISLFLFPLLRVSSASPLFPLHVSHHSIPFISILLFRLLYLLIFFRCFFPFLAFYLLLFCCCY